MMRLDDRWSLVDPAYYCFNLNRELSGELFFDKVLTLNKILIDLVVFPKVFIFLSERLNLNLLFSTLNLKGMGYLLQV